MYRNLKNCSCIQNFKRTDLNVQHVFNKEKTLIICPKKMKQEMLSPQSWHNSRGQDAVQTMAQLAKYFPNTYSKSNKETRFYFNTLVI